MEKKKRIGISLVMVFLLAINGMVMAGCGKDKATDTPDTTRTVVDMAGRKVILPKEVNRIVTSGPLPVVNSLIFAVGEGDKIVNGLPNDDGTERYKYQFRFAPNLAKQPCVQINQSRPNIEELLNLKPDIVFIMGATSEINEKTTQLLTEAGLCTVHIYWTDSKEVKQAINLIGEVLNQEIRAKDYSKYFDDTVVRVSKIVDTIPEDKRPRVLHCNMERMTTELAISDWWIKQAGGISITADDPIGENKGFSVEQLLKWDPEIMVVGSKSQVDLLYNDIRFKEIKAVKNRQVFTAPRGAHGWGWRTSEQPLMLLWAAKTFHPEAFKDLDMEEESIFFYKQFFKYSMTVEEAREILSGGPEVKSDQKK